MPARSRPGRPRYRQEDISAYQQFQPGAAARLRRAQDRRACGLANSRRWNGDHALNAMTLDAMTAFSLGGSAPLQKRRRTRSNAPPDRRDALSQSASVSPAAAWRQAEQGTGAGLGAEPLLLPEHIPIKDAVVISRFRDRGIRLEWRHRIEDHDGDVGAEGGIERWLKLTEGLGLDSAYVESAEGILPATRFAVEPTCISSATRRRSKPSPPRSPNCSRRTCMKSAFRECWRITISSIPTS